MNGENLDQHRRELDATFEALKSVRATLEVDAAVIGDVIAELAALGQRVARLEGLVAALDAPVELDAGRHSRGVGAAIVSEPFVVVNMESDEREVVGTYLRTVEDVVEYRDELGNVRHAPVDCVEVTGPNRLAELRRNGAQS